MAGGPKAGAAKAAKPKDTPPETVANAEDNKKFEKLWKKLETTTNKTVKELDEHIKKVCWFCIAASVSSPCKLATSAYHWSC